MAHARGLSLRRRSHDGSDSVENAQRRARVAFEFIEKLGAPFYAFHDRDVAPEGKTLSESHKNLDAVVKVLKEEQQRTGRKFASMNERELADLSQRHGWELLGPSPL